nr:MAG TPA: hypothetical protein [Bacteriophage sp.]
MVKLLTSKKIPHRLIQYGLRKNLSMNIIQHTLYNLK